MLLSGLFASLWGWESIFYIMGIATCAWLLLWAIFIADTPMSQRFISENEREKINSSLYESGSEQVQLLLVLTKKCITLLSICCRNILSFL